jgi:uncharacterized cupin superfamily protein
VGIAHWDEVGGTRTAAGPIASRSQDLGTAAGSRDVGLRRFWIEPDGWLTPVHRHGAEEEIFVLVEGSGRSWQDGKTWEVGAGDVLLHRRREEAHTLVAGPGGLSGLVFGTRIWTEAIELPRAEVAWLRPAWVEVGKGKHPFERERKAGPLLALEDPPQTVRPERIARLEDVPVERREHGSHGFAERKIGRALGSVTCGLREHVIDPGLRGAPLHCHSAEEEVFLVLAGEGALELGEERTPVRAGHAVSRLPATGVGHAFVAGPGGPLRLLAFGTREPNDLCLYPRSNKVAFRGLGITTRIEGSLGYWDGED